MPPIKSKSTRPDTPTLLMLKMSINSSAFNNNRYPSPGLLPPKESESEKQVFDILF